MASKLSDARKSLQRAKEAAQTRLKQLDAERRELKASIKQLNVALKALGTNGIGGRPKPADHGADPAVSDSISQADSADESQHGHLG